MKLKSKDSLEVISEGTWIRVHVREQDRDGASVCKASAALTAAELADHIAECAAVLAMTLR